MNLGRGNENGNHIINRWKFLRVDTMESKNKAIDAINTHFKIFIPICCMAYPTE